MDIANLKQNGKAEALLRISLKAGRINIHLLMLVCLIYILVQGARVINK